MRKHLNQSTVKTLKHILWAFLTTTVLAGCSDDLTYTSGAEDDPDNYGVYFPEQTSPTEVERDPAEEATVTYKVRRAKYLDAITVPVAVTASEEGIFEIEPITFGPGEQETEFTVTFPKAEEGEKYTCDIRIEDPRYISLYGPRATGLSFSVIRAGWELVTNADGTATKGKWRDDLIGNLYSLPSATFNPNPEIEVEIYQRRDIKGYYRMKVYGDAFMETLAGGPVNYQGRDLYTIVDARDPNKVFIPYQSTGLTLVNGDGELSIASDVAENFMMDESTGQYGTLKDGIITFPAQSVLIELEKKSGSFYHVNANGMLRILLPGIVVPDYTVKLAKGEPADGVVEIAATLAKDVEVMKFAVFEGALDSGQASLTAQDMDAAKTFDGEIKTSGTIRVENKATGKYTLVGCIYDKEGVMRDYASVSFGYIAKGDEKPVILTMGLEATQEFAGQGITPDNSAKFYAFGEGIESVVYGLFRTDRLRGADPDELLDAQGIQFTAGQLAALNAGHFSTMFTGLNGDSDYTLLLRAGNGYIHKTMQATYRTTGTYNPALDTFTYADFLPALDQPSINDLTATTWNYYAVNYADGTEHPIRRKIGQVTMDLNTEQSSSDLPILNVNGLSGIEFDEGGAIFGMYIPGISMFQGYNGALALFTNQELTTGTYKGQTAIMGFMTEEDGTSIYFGYCMFMGAVADGYLYCVPAPQYVEQGHTFRYLFTGSSSSLYSLMDEMMLVDPAKDLGGISGAALERIAALRKQALGAFTPRNYVERPEFSIPAGHTPEVKPVLPINLVTTPMPASAPAVKRAEVRVSVVRTAPVPTAAATATTTTWSRNTGLQRIEK